MLKVKFLSPLTFYTKLDFFLDMSTLIKMYYSFVSSYYIYCIEISDNASAIHLDPLKNKKITVVYKD